jgi:hypothetical protein
MALVLVLAVLGLVVAMAVVFVVVLVGRTR